MRTADFNQIINLVNNLDFGFQTGRCADLKEGPDPLIPCKIQISFNYQKYASTLANFNNRRIPPLETFSGSAHSLYNMLAFYKDN